MRIYKKPKIPKITCRECGCVFKPHVSDLTRDNDLSWNIFVTCPVCRSLEYAHLEKTNRIPKCSNCYFWSEKSKHCHLFGKNMYPDDFCSRFISLIQTKGKRYEEINPPREANDVT